MPDRRPRPDTDADADPADGRLESGWSGILLLLALLLLGAQLPWALLAAVPALVGTALSALVVHRRLRAGSRAGAAWAGIGVLFGVYVLGLTGVQAVVYRPMDAYRRCTATAATDVAQAACDAELEGDLGAAWVAFLD